ncbi:MAG: hypothetical protein AAF394_00290, partial [Planctomycetota bacterium]
MQPAVGDEVQGYDAVNGKWLTGKVVQVAPTFASVQYETLGGHSRAMFPFARLRYPWQARVISPVYEWQDESGALSLKGAVVDFDSQARTVTLYDLEQSKDVVVGVDKLIDSDKLRLRRIVENAPPKTVALPPLQQFDETAADAPDESFWSAPTNLADVAPDPPRAPFWSPPGALKIPKTSKDDLLMGLSPIGTASGWVSAITVDGVGAGRLYWGTLADGKIQKVQGIPGSERLRSVDAANQQILTASFRDKKEILAVWSASPKKDVLTPIARWENRMSAARFVGPDRVLTHRGFEGFVVWDFKQQRAICGFERVNKRRGLNFPVVSPGGRYAVIHEDKWARVVSLEDGSTLAALPVIRDAVLSVAFDPKGEKLLVMTQADGLIWKLGSSDPPERVNTAALKMQVTEFQTTWVDE